MICFARAGLALWRDHDGSRPLTRGTRKRSSTEHQPWLVLRDLARLPAVQPEARSFEKEGRLLLQFVRYFHQLNPPFLGCQNQ